MKPAAALPSSAPRLRCAIYTRKSSDEGLEQEFNSLDAQRDACEAYVLSQAGEGWQVHPERYDDGGFSGGNIQRPALQRLLRDVEAGRIKVVVLYKVDRLTRSLGDFSKIVEVLDRAGASFVSVTQAFNTTTSMGRLTLNMLLSFAQFEREITGERIRDKLAASKRKGMWMGGQPPLGYDPDGRTLKINADEAATVRMIFQRYLDLGSVAALREEISAAGVVSKRWTQKSGAIRGGEPFSRGALHYLLSNRIYVGRIAHKGEHHPGLHPALISEELFARVQTRLLENGGDRRRARAGLPERPRAPLQGLVRGEQGQAMSPSITRKADGRTYRYYVSAAAAQGGTPLPHVPADAIEALVLERAAPLIGVPTASASWGKLRQAIATVTFAANAVTIGVKREALDTAINLDAVSHALPAGDRLIASDEMISLEVSARLRVRAGSRLVVGAAGQPATRSSPVDLTLLRGLIRAEAWKRALLSGGKVTLDDLAKGEGVQRSYARRMLRLAFLSPRLKRCIVTGATPAGLTLQKLMTQGVPDIWREQEALAFT